MSLNLIDIRESIFLFISVGRISDSTLKKIVMDVCKLLENNGEVGSIY